MTDRSTSSILIIAGEASGDRHAAALVGEIQALRDNCSFWGIGGDHLRARGVETLYDAAQMNVIGFVEVLKRYRFFRSVLDSIIRTAAERRPAFAILVDYPGFNLRLARQLHALGIPVVYYIAPQVWAWKERRVEEIRKYVRDLIVVFPFEVAFFAKHGVTAHFFGHPMIDDVVDDANAIVRGGFKPPPTATTIAYLPGSRREEIERHMPVLTEVMAALGPSFRHMIPLASTVSREVLEPYRQRANFEIVNSAHEALSVAGAALVKSGTSTLDALLLDVPCAVFYKTSTSSYHIVKWLINVRFIAMINVLAGRMIVREFIQNSMTASALLAELRALLENQEYRGRVLEGMREVRDGLGQPGSAARVARFIVDRYLT
ncbi:MAG: lipid-A-disaccharide synthase [Candidatus Kapaibacterium sp.]